MVADEPDHRFADIGKKVVLSLVFRDKVVEKVPFQYDKKPHLSPLIIGNLGPSGNAIFLINIINILFYKLKVLIVLFLSHDIKSFLEFFKQEITEKYLNSLDVDVRNVGEVFAFSGG